MKLPGFGVEEWLNEWETKATYDLAQSTIASMTMEEIISLSKEKANTFYEEINSQKMNYGEIEGSAAFKEEVSKMYINMNSDNILQTNGATGANLLACYALLEPGDHVISQYPSYQQLYDIPKSYGADVDFWNIYEENNWYPKIEKLKELIRPNTKMICINNALNPTGTVLEKDFLLQVVEIAREVGAYILVDEVYMPLDDNVEFIQIADIYEKGISTNSLSKTYSVPGVRIGWIAASKEITDIFRGYRDYTMICNGVFNDILAVHILKYREEILERNSKIVNENLEILKAWVEQEELVSCIFPQSVSTSFVKVNIKDDIEGFCLKLLKEKGVLLVPGNKFDIEGHVRLGYCTDKETLKIGLAKISEFLEEYK